jgi:hypothetical protein
MELNISDYIIYHIKKHWKKLLNELYLNVFDNKLKNLANTFFCIHIITKPPSYPYFTICLFKISNYNEVFIMLSDHIDGVYKRLYNEKYIINNQIKCLYLTNTLKDNEIYECKIENTVEIKNYIYVNWNDGEILYNNLYKIKKINKLSKNKLISLIKLNSLFKFGLNKLSREELFDFIIKYNIKTSIK